MHILLSFFEDEAVDLWFEIALGVKEPEAHHINVAAPNRAPLMQCPQLGRDGDLRAALAPIARLRHEVA